MCPVEKVFTGQILRTELSPMVPAPIRHAAIWALKQLSPSLRIYFEDGQRPEGLAGACLLAPLLATSQVSNHCFLFFCTCITTFNMQVVHAADGSSRYPPNISDRLMGKYDDLTFEDLSLMGEKFRGMSASQRRKFFARKLEEPSGLVFDPRIVYTFGFWSDALDPTSFTVKLPYLPYTFKVASMLKKNPVQLMACLMDVVDGDGDPEWHLAARSLLSGDSTYLWCAELRPAPGL